MSAAARGILVIAGENYPPWTSPGSIRLAKTSELLVEHGWRPVVLTCRPPEDLTVRLDAPSTPGVEIHRTIELDPLKTRFARPELRRDPSTTVRVDGGARSSRLASAARRAYAAVSFPDRDWLWYPVGLRAGRRLMRRAEPTIEAIWSTSPSITAHLIARRLRRLTSVPWIAEFRDPWAWSAIRPARGAVRGRLERRLERRLCASADRVVSVSRGYLDELRAVHALDGERTGLVLNGFDPEDFAALPRPDRFERFSLAHAGQLYGGRRGLAVVLHALRSLIDDGRIPARTVSLELYGEPDARVDAEARAHGLERQLHWHGYLPYPEMLRALSASYLQLLLTHDTRPTLPSKLFDYLGVGRPTIAVAHETSEVAAIVRETGMGQVVAHHDVTRMREVLIDYWSRWRAGDVTAPDLAAAAAPYTRRRQVATFASLLQQTCGERRVPTAAAERSGPTASVARRHG